MVAYGKAMRPSLVDVIAEVNALDNRENYVFAEIGYDPSEQPATCVVSQQYETLRGIQNNTLIVYDLHFEDTAIATLDNANVRYVEIQYQFSRYDDTTQAVVFDKVTVRMNSDNSAEATVDSDTFSGGSYTLPTASADTLGGVKVGSGLAIDNEGVLSASGGDNAFTFIYESVYGGSLRAITPFNDLLAAINDRKSIYIQKGESGMSIPVQSAFANYQNTEIYIFVNSTSIEYGIDQPIISLTIYTFTNENSLTSKNFESGYNKQLYLAGNAPNYYTYDSARTLSAYFNHGMLRIAAPSNSDYGMAVCCTSKSNLMEFTYIAPNSNKIPTIYTIDIANTANASGQYSISVVSEQPLFNQ